MCIRDSACPPHSTAASGLLRLPALPAPALPASQRLFSSVGRAAAAAALGSVSSSLVSCRFRPQHVACPSRQS
eukprot:688239-Pleurochrysis_carterae.AAC.1